MMEALISLVMYLVIEVGLIGFWLWMLVDCARHEVYDDARARWIILMVLTNCLGAALYFFTRRRERRRIEGR
jgi:hypothetical protein